MQKQYIYCLKKLITITLLAVHLFNLAGYNILFQYFINKSEKRLIQQLDVNKYDEQDLIVLKIPMYLPYYNSSGGTERVDGAIEMDGTHYNYVKRSVKNDTLYLYCIPNADKTKLSQTKNNFIKQASDNQSDTQKGSNALMKKMKWGAEYSEAFFLYAGSVLKTASQQKTGFLLHAIAFPPFVCPYKPPEWA